MATIKLTGLTNLQARVIFEKIEDGDWDNFNKYLKDSEVNEIDLQDTDQRFDENGDSDYTITFAEVEPDIIDDELDPDGDGVEDELKDDGDLIEDEESN